MSRNGKVEEAINASETRSRQHLKEIEGLLGEIPPDKFGEVELLLDAAKNVAQRRAERVKAEVHP